MAKLKIKIHISAGIIYAIPCCMQFGCNYIQNCRFPTAVIAMKNVDIIKIKNPKVYFRKNAEWITAFKELFAVTTFFQSFKDSMQGFLL